MHVCSSVPETSDVLLIAGRFHACTSCSMILYSIGHKQLCNTSTKDITHEFPLAETCLHALSHCGQVNFVARRFYSMLWPSYNALKARFNEMAEREQSSTTSTNLAISDILNPETLPDTELRSIVDPRQFFTVPSGNSAVHKACRDLLKVVHRPFSRDYLDRSANSPRALLFGEQADWRFEIPTPFNWQNTDWFAWTIAEEQERNALEVLTSIRATERKRKAVSGKTQG